MKNILRDGKPTLLLAIFLAAIVCSSTAWAIDLEWHGFGSVYDGQALSSNLAPYTLTNQTGVPDTHVNFTSFSLFGLNVSGTINEDLTAAAQLIALGSPVGASDSFALIAQWAFVNYTPMNSLSIKAGRQLLPVFLASDYVRVGFLLPYRQVPSQIFLLSPYTRFDGLSVNKTFDLSGPMGGPLSEMKLTASAFGGRPAIDLSSTTLAESDITFQYQDLFGAQVLLDGEGWRLKATAFQNFIQVTSPAGTTEGHNNFVTLGYRFDHFGIVSWGEYMASFCPDCTQVSNGGRADATSHGFYLLNGYRIGRFLPRYTFAQASEESNTFIITQGIPAILNGRTTSHTFGVNYQAGTNAVIKVEYEIDLVPSPQGGGYFVKQPLDATTTSGSSFYAGVDFIF